MLALASLPACSPARDAPSGAPQEAAAVEPAFPNGLAPVTTGWEAEPAQLAAATCAAAGCHADARAGWAEGMHARSWRDPVFLEALARDTRPWCVHCHAPLATQLAAWRAGERADADARALLDEGINCAACHVREGRILGTRERPDAPHAVTVSDRLGSAAFCADCHQFNFPAHYEIAPGDPFVYGDEPMQDTHAEWLASGVAQSCGECHRAAGHRLLGPHDREWLGEAVFGAAELQRDGAWLEVSVPLRVPRGHRLPTGDVFHTLELEVARDAEFADVVARERWGRTLGSPLAHASRIVADTSLGADASALGARLEVPADGPLFVRLRYHYADPALPAGALPDEVRAAVLWSARLEAP